MKPIDATQIKIIHIAVAQLGLSDDDYRLILAAQCGGKSSSKDLTYKEAHGLIEYFKTLGFRVKSNRRRCSLCRPRISRGPVPHNVILLLSPEQLAMINSLRAEIRWRYMDGYERWLKKYMKLSTIRTSLEASRVIEGLKGLLRSQQNCRACDIRN